MPKTSLRQTVLKNRRHLAPQTCLALSWLVQERVLALPEFIAASCLALYSPIMNEVFTEEILVQANRMGKRVAYPRVRGDRLEFVLAGHRKDLVPGAFGILEPSRGEPLALAEIDLMIVPGVAFDTNGHRLGYGKGFYDRALHALPGPTMLAGLCFELQVVARLPAEDHDIRIDLLVTENRILDFRQHPQPVASLPAAFQPSQ
jgi:5-formyltetrahydrofolate cyclo-ligase